jgi:hypothetical protein
MNKKIIVVDLILVLGSLLLISGLVGYSMPLVVAPLDDYVSTNGSVLFEFDNADLILIDDNLDFTSPDKIYVQNDLVVKLKPGTYYWKIQGMKESDIRKLTIESEVSLRLKKFENEYKVVNSGNDRLNVDIYDGGKLAGNVVLDVEDSIEVGENDKFIGGKNG